MTPIPWRAPSLLPSYRHALPASRTGRLLLAVLLAAGTGRGVPASAQTAAPDSLAAGMQAAAPDSLRPAAPPVRLEFLSPDSVSTPEEQPPIRRRITFGGEFAWGRGQRTTFRPWMRYNRVQGLALYGEVGRDMEHDGWQPGYHAGFGYGFAARRGWYGLGFEQPLMAGGDLSIGVDAHRSAIPFFYGDEVIGEGENSAATFFLHRDYRDWYEAEGGRLFLAGRPARDLRVSVGMVLEEERSLPQATDWSVFRQKADFRPNPEIPEGDYRGFELSATLDTRPRGDASRVRSPRTSWGAVEHWHRVTYERGGGGLGGDFDLWKATADLRSYLRVSPRQTLSARLLAGMGESRSLAWAPGGSSGDQLPIERRYAVGGLGTLRGHNYREFRGNRVALANIEYAFALADNIRTLVFADAGRAWDDGSLMDLRVPVDMGIGFSAGDEGVSVLAARNVNRSDADIKVSVRFQHSF